MRIALGFFAAFVLLGLLFFTPTSNNSVSSADGLSSKSLITPSNLGIPATTYSVFLPLVAGNCPFSPQTHVQWDARLGPGGLPRLEHVRIIPANVVPGQVYWRVVSVVFENIDQSGSDHSIYARIIDETCNRLFGVPLYVYSDTTGEMFPDQPTEQPAGAVCNCNYMYPMWGDGYDIILPYPSDEMAGMIMPLRRHVNYRIVFQRTTR
jgi:hypothetical protein